MSTLKTKIDETEVLSFLQKKIDPGIISLEFLKGGEMSQAFGFSNDNKHLVIRVNTQFYSFEKDKYAWDHFNRTSIPMPEIIGMGEMRDGLYYAISERVAGQNFDTLPVGVQKSLLPQLLVIHDAIRESKIAEGKYGHWNGSGEANCDTWKDFILSYDDDIYGKWDELYAHTCLEKEIIEEVYKKLNELVLFVPEDRYLVHGDFACNNAVSDGKTITGILDWGESSYGDTLYDIAWVDFWFEELGFASLAFDHYRKSGISVVNYDLRLLCYKLRLGVGSLGFFAKSNQKNEYDKQKSRLLKLLSI